MRTRLETGKRTLAALLGGVAAQSFAFGALAQDGSEQGRTEQLILDPVVVEGDPSVVTEGSGSYASDRATVGYKQPVDLRDVPQSITVITRERLDDADANSLEDAAELIPNVYHATGNLFAGSLYSRGHEVFTYNVDGAPRPFLSLYGTSPDMVFFDRVEVLSGPSGVFQGSGEPVGTINLVRKRPRTTFGASGAVSAGRYNAYRAEGDVTGPLAADGDLRGRVIGFGETQESFVDYVEQDSGGGYASLEYDVGDDTTLAIGGIAETEDTVSFSGLPTFTTGQLIDLPRDTYVGADWNSREIETVEAFAEAEHEFDFGGVLKLTSRTYDRNADIKVALPSTGVDPATGDFDLFTFARDFDERTSYFDANLTTPFSFLGRASEVTFGADYRLTEQDTKQNFDFSAGTHNIFAFDPESVPEPTITFPGVGPGFRLNTETESDEIGVYGYARLQVLDGLNLTLGGRYAAYDSETEDTGRGTTTEVSENRFVPLLGLSYDVTEQVTTYASYSEIFQPQSEITAGGEQLEPIIGRQIELGTKASFFGDALQAQAAVFWLEDENRAIDDPDNVGSFIAAGEAQTRGFEAFVTGSPHPAVDLALGYTFVDTDLESDPSPPHSGVVSAKYTFLAGPLQNFYLGAGMRAVSDFDIVSGGTEIEADGYAIFNALAGYPVNENLELQLFVNNIFDKKYVQRVNDVTRGTFYGEPFTATIRVSARF